MIPHYVDDPARQCQGKRAFESKADAKHHIKTSASRLGGFDRKPVAYRCPHCNLFHVGGQGVTRSE